MNPSLLPLTALASSFLALFASSEWLYHKRKVHSEVTRKYVHLITGLLTLVFPLVIDNHWLILALCGSFWIILMASKKFNFLKSINQVHRSTSGATLFPIVVYSCFLLFQHFDQLLFYYVPILILAICDPVAALVGKRWPWGKYRTFGYRKTMSGSLGFLGTAVLISAGLLLGFTALPIGTVLLISTCLGLATTLAEALTHRGFDNLTIPMTAWAVLMLFNAQIPFS